MARDVLPWLGARPCREVEPPELLEVLRRIQMRSPETAHRALRLCGFVFRLAVASGRATRNPALDLKGILPTARVTHFPAATEPEAFASVLRRVHGYRGTFPVACALKMLPLLFVRPGELIAMRWADVDFEAAEWRYLVSKTQTPHLVPLAPQVVALLRELRPLTGHREHVFTVRAGGAPISGNTLNAALRACGIDTSKEHTGHGFRAAARTQLAERLGFRPEVIEHQLAHAVPDALGAAYNRTRFLAERTEMMQRWADYCDQLLV